MLRKKNISELMQLLIVSCFATLLTFLISAWLGAPFSLWFDDIAYVILVGVGFVFFMALVWDSVLILCMQQRWRFFPQGALSLVLIGLTIYTIGCTSNVVLISLKLLGPATQWHDAILWNLEGDWIRLISFWLLPVRKWDLIYFCFWFIELASAFFLIVFGRSKAIFQNFCLSLILVYYIGRYLAVVYPVMGPAFEHPEYFSYLHGTTSQSAMAQLTEIMSLSPDLALQRGGAMLGGISAMPSLHVAMAFLTTSWLAKVSRWSLVFTIPWFILNWLSTIVLGWHYILDGVAGVVLGILVMGITWFIHRYGCLSTSCKI